MKDNRGFSLVEVVIAIAIVAVVTAASSLTYSLISRANVEKGMQILESTMGKLQTECTSKSQPTYMYVYQDSSDEDYYMKISKNLYTSVSGIMSDSAEAERIESASVSVYFIASKSENGVSAGPHQVKGSTFVAVTYNKSDSSVMAYMNGTKKFPISAIQAYGSKKQAKVEIAYETGKVSYSATNI